MASQASKFMALVVARFKEYSKYPVWMLSAYIQMILIFLLFGLAASLFVPKGATGNYWIIPVAGIFLFITGGINFAELSTDVVWLSEQGVMESLVLAPVNPALSLFAYSFVVTGYMLVLGSLVTVGVALFAKITLHPIPWLALTAFILHSAFMTGLGYALAGLSFRIKRGIFVYSNALNLLFLIFCGYFYLFSALPRPMLLVSKVIPISYMVDLFRYSLTSDPSLVTISSLRDAALISSASAVAMLVFGVLAFSRELRRALDGGYLGFF